MASLALTQSVAFSARPRAFVNRGIAAVRPNKSAGFSSTLPQPLSFSPSRRASRPTVVCGLFGLGLPELLVVGGVALILFGPKQLPEVGKSLGKTVKGFQEAAKEFQSELTKATDGETVAATEKPKESAAATPPVTTQAEEKKQ